MNDLNKVPEHKYKIFDDVVHELRDHMADPKACYPHVLVKEILEKSEQTVPKLLAILDEFFAQSLRDMSDETWREGIFVLLLLAKLREKRAFPYVVRLCSLPYKALEDFGSQVIIKYTTELLVSTFNGDCNALYSLVTNQHLYHFSRSWALLAYVTLYKHDMMSREHILKVFSDLFTELYDDFSLVPSMLVGCCDYVHATELSEQIDNYFLNDMVDPRIISQDKIKKSFVLSKKDALKKLREDTPDLFFVNDIEGFSKRLFERDQHDCDHDRQDQYNAFGTGSRSRSSFKVGRNDPCLCRSGKKYKKCCLGN